MSDFVNTDVKPLVILKNNLIIFRDETESMSKNMGNILDEFENNVYKYYRQMADIPGWENNNEDFMVLWNTYLNCRDIFIESINRILQHKIINSEGQRNLYTLISILDEYFSKLP